MPSKVWSVTPIFRLASATVLPSAMTISACRSFLIVCSGVCFRLAVCTRSMAQFLTFLLDPVSAGRSLARHTPGHPYDDEVDDFVNAVLDWRRPATDARDGSNTAIAIICGIQAMESGATVAIPNR